MHDHPSSGRDDGAPQPDSAEHPIQRWVLAELITTTPPADGDEIDELAAALHERRQDVATAVDTLVHAGLALRDDDTVRASGAALQFELLWPLRP